MTNTPHRRPAPLSVRLSEKERALLVRRAAGKPLSSYEKSVLFVRDDRESLARFLAWLGQSQIAAHLAILANAAESVSLDMNEPVTQAMLKACVGAPTEMFAKNNAIVLLTGRRELPEVICL